MKTFEYHQPFTLESGAILPGLTIAYYTYGKLNAGKNNVVWVCHALTANADAASWWKGLVGEGCIFDSEQHFIVCANIIGSSYGSTGPLSIDPETGEAYYDTFPQITIRDMVNAHILLRKHLGIENIYLMAGGSMGGYQAIEWSVMEKERISNLFLIATSVTESAWGIAVHETQRLSIEADCTWKHRTQAAGQAGLKAARAVAMLTYRNYNILVDKQADADVNKLDDYKAASYINYQGEKLANRFNAYSYWLLTKAMDSHHLARGRANHVDEVMATMPQKTLIIGIDSDILCPLVEQQHMANCIPGATFHSIDSPYGHDGFIVEVEKIAGLVRQWLQDETTSR